MHQLQSDTQWEETETVGDNKGAKARPESDPERKGKGKGKDAKEASAAAASELVPKELTACECPQFQTW
jgi:hypothetical protein